MRLELTKKTDLALRSLRALAGTSQDRVGGRELAETIGTSAPFLAQVMAPLVRKGWVDSKPGTSGGYTLAVEPDSVTILQLVELLEGPVDDGRCVLEGRECSESDHCSLHDAWGRARDALIRELAVTCVADCS